MRLLKLTRPRLASCLAGVVLAATIGGACQSTGSDMSSTTVAPSQDLALAGTSWVAVEIDGVATGNTRSTLTFESDARVVGSTGCNQYFGSLTLSQGAFRLGPIGSTRMACEPPFMEQERRFVEALAAVSAHRVDGTALILVDGSGRTRVRLTRGR